MQAMRHGLRARRPGVMAMLALVVTLALAGCGSLGSLPNVVTKTASPHATTTPKPALDWRAVALPAGLDAKTTSIAVSPVNGSEAWLCAPATGAQSYEVWRTNDAGVTWRKASYLTLSTSQAISTCALAANQSDANAVAVNLTWSDASAPVGGPQGTQSYYSVDGGATWTTLPEHIWVQQVTTVGANTYAQLADTSQRSVMSLVISADHLATWATVSAPGQDTHPDFQFWAASTPGELLWANMNGGGALYTDHNGSGGVWNAVTPPAQGDSLQVTQAVWQPAQATGFQANGWLICGYVQAASTQAPTENAQGATAQNAMNNVCTHDRGATWTTFPALKNTWECAHCGQGGVASSGDNPCLASAIAESGALYAVCGNDPQDSGVAPTPWTVSRMAPGGSSWTTLGQAPCHQLTTTQTGQAWCIDPVAHAAYVLATLP